MTYGLICGDAVTALRQLPDESVDCCVTSPPYFGLRSYLGGDHEIGQERTPDEYVASLVLVFREVRRVLKPEGTLWLNLGDCYATGAGKVGDCPGGGGQGERFKGYRGTHTAESSGKQAYRMQVGGFTQANRMPLAGLKPKDLIGIPWRVAFALQADGWWLRQWMPWIKRNGMPESTRDRPTSSCETVFLLSKSQDYFYDYEAVQKPVRPDTVSRYGRGRTETHKWADGGPGNQTIAKTLSHMKQDGHSRRHAGFNEREFAKDPREMRARRNSDWATESVEGLLSSEDRSPVAFFVNTTGCSEAHFAVMPEKLAEPCILAGCAEGGTVLDPFAGSGTTGVVSLLRHRNFIGIDLNPEYIDLARRRISRAASPLFGDEEVA